MSKNSHRGDCIADGLGPVFLCGVRAGQQFVLQFQQQRGKQQLFLQQQWRCRSRRLPRASGPAFNGNHCRPGRRQRAYHRTWHRLRTGPAWLQQQHGFRARQYPFQFVRTRCERHSLRSQRCQPVRTGGQRSGSSSGGVRTGHRARPIRGQPPSVARGSLSSGIARRPRGRRGSPAPCAMRCRRDGPASGTGRRGYAG